MEKSPITSDYEQARDAVRIEHQCLAFGIKRGDFVSGRVELWKRPWYFWAWRTELSIKVEVVE